MTVNTLSKKLQFKPDQQALILNAPSGYLDRLTPLPEGVVLFSDATDGNFDFVQVFVKNKEELESLLPTVLKASIPDSLIWIAYLKGGKKAGTDLNRDILWEAVSQHNLTGVSLIALDENWSAMRFRPTERVGQK